MSGLHELQKKFQDYVLVPEPGMEDEVAGTANADAATRLEIYSDAYRLRLIEALAGDYETVKALAGEIEFDRLAREYIAAHPSTHYNVRWFGAAFADFLREAAADSPHLSETARFEWAMTLAFDAPDEPAIAVEAMAQIPAQAWPGMTFVAHPSLQLLQLDFNVPEIWKAVDSGGKLPSLRHETVPWIIWRRDYKTYFRSVSDDENFALGALVSGASFADICAGLTEWVDEDSVALHAAGLLKGWISEGLLRSVSVAA